GRSGKWIIAHAAAIFACRIAHQRTIHGLRPAEGEVVHASAQDGSVAGKLAIHHKRRAEITVHHSTASTQVCAPGAVGMKDAINNHTGSAFVVHPAPAQFRVVAYKSASRDGWRAEIIQD